MPPQAPSTAIVVRGGDVQRASVRSNPALSKLEFFSNFGGGYLVSAGIAEHPAGEGCGTHTHRGAVELFVVIGGSGVIEVDGVAYDVSVDDCVLVPVGANHNLIGTSTDALFRVLYAFVVAPGHENGPVPWKSIQS